MRILPLQSSYPGPPQSVGVELVLFISCSVRMRNFACQFYLLLLLKSTLAVRKGALRGCILTGFLCRICLVAFL